MKTLNNYIIEKLKITKDNIPNTIDITKEMFSIICMYILSYIKEEDLYNEFLKDNYISWGELDTYHAFKINFSHYPWIEDIAFSEEPNKQEIRDLMDDLAISIKDIYVKFINKCKTNQEAHSYTMLTVLYLIEYVNKGYLTTDNIDFEKIKYAKLFNHEYYFNQYNMSNLLNGFDHILKDLAIRAKKLVNK